MGLITYTNLEDGTPITANVFNKRFAQIIAQVNGNLDAANFANDGISKEKLKQEVYESIYPVGSMYVNFTDSTNPATLLGFGTWQAIAGRMVAGYDGTQTEFNASEKTGGHKKLQAHTHTTATNTTNATLGQNGNFGVTRASYAAYTSTYDTSSTGDGDGQNLPPYIVGYVWKRLS